MHLEEAFAEHLAHFLGASIFLVHSCGAIERDLLGFDSITAANSVGYYLSKTESLISVVRHVGGADFPRPRSLKERILEHLSTLSFFKQLAEAIKMSVTSFCLLAQLSER